MYTLRSTMLLTPRVLSRRALSSQTNCAVEKLRGVLEEYRLRNYTQEIPTRFKKEIVQAACVDTMGSGAVEVNSFERVLNNIGIPQSDISHEDIMAIFKEIGNEQGQIPAQKMFQLL